MINAFTLHSAITESVGRSQRYNVEPYNFIGDLDGSTFNEATEIMLTEASLVQDMYTKTDELITEAVSNGAPMNRVNAMIESVFSNILDTVKKVWNKILEAIRGLIAKIKAFALRITNQTTKWCNAMKAKIEAQHAPGASSAKGEMHDWNTELFTKLAKTDTPNTDAGRVILDSLGELKEALTSISSNIKNIKGSGDTDYDGGIGVVDRGYEKGDDGGYKRSAEKDKISANYNYSGSDKKISQTPEQEKALNKKLDELQKKTEGLEKSLAEEVRKNYIKHATAYGVTGTDEAAILSNIKTKLYGEKKTITYGSQVNNMFNYVKDSATLITEVTAHYNNRREQIQNELDKISDFKNEVDNITADSNQVQTAIWGKYKANFSAVINQLTTLRSDDQKMFNGLKSLTTAAIKERAVDYMRLLTKYANAKSFE